MKQLLEEYLIETLQLREQTELLGRLIAVMRNDLITEDIWERNPTEIPMTELQAVTPPDIRIEDEVLHLG